MGFFTGGLLNFVFIGNFRDSRHEKKHSLAVSNLYVKDAGVA